MGKFKETVSSKKFLVTVSGIVVVVANEYFGLKFDSETVLAVATMISAYVLGQSHVDGKKVDK